MNGSYAANKGIGLFPMLCVTLTLANRVPAETAAQTIDQLVTSLNVHPDAVGGDVSAFKAIGQRQVQGCLGSADETVGFILSAARSATWGVHLALVEAQGESWTSSADGIRGRQLQEHAQTSGKRSCMRPGESPWSWCVRARSIGRTKRLNWVRLNQRCSFCVRLSVAAPKKAKKPDL